MLSPASFASSGETGDWIVRIDKEGSTLPRKTRNWKVGATNGQPITTGAWTRIRARSAGRLPPRNWPGVLQLIRISWVPFSALAWREDPRSFGLIGPSRHRSFLGMVKRLVAKAFTGISGEGSWARNWEATRNRCTGSGAARLHFGSAHCACLAASSRGYCVHSCRDVGLRLERGIASDSLGSFILISTSRMVAFVPCPSAYQFFTIRRK